MPWGGSEAPASAKEGWKVVSALCGLGDAELGWLVNFLSWVVGLFLAFLEVCND